MDTQPCSVCGVLLPHDVFRTDGVIRICATCAPLPEFHKLAQARATAIKQYRASRKRPGGRMLSAEAHAAERARRLSALTQFGKRCADCHHTKPVAEYHADRRRADGLQAGCIDCAKIKRGMRRAGQYALWPTVRDQLRVAT